MNTPAFNVVIPARYASTRLPGKPLLDIAGQPMIAHVCARAQEAGASQIIVATDDQRIVQVVEAQGISAMMTRADHQSGTERIAEVAERLAWPDETLIVNLQGDEPLIPPGYLQAAASALANQQRAGIATLAAAIHDPEEIFNPNAVKVVLDQQGYALYFSRAPIPWERGVFTAGGGEPSGQVPHLRHIGLYAYSVAFLKRYCVWPSSPLEAVEALEQLRILWQGEAVKVGIVPETPPPGVDTPEDLVRVARVLSGLSQ